MESVTGNEEPPLREQVARYGWYHTIDLGQGVVTPGAFDLRPMMTKLPFPESLADLRCLDVGTANGFFAFEMAKRGAETVAIDLADVSKRDWPPRSDPALRYRTDDGVRGAFDVARAAIAPAVEWRDVDLYRADEAGLGEFDLIFIGNILLHLRDPVAALNALRPLLTETGRLVSLEPVVPWLSVLFRRQPVARFQGVMEPYWWQANRAGHQRIVAAAGFDIFDTGRLLRMPWGPGHEVADLSGIPLRVRSAVAVRERVGLFCSCVQAVRADLDGAA